MKKLMAVMLVVCMIFTILPMGISVGATETGTETSTDPTLIFDMDLSASTASAIAVADSSNSGKTGTITYGVSNNGRKPTYGETKQGTKYLNFETAENLETLLGSDGVSSYANTLAVNVPLTGDAGQAVYDADELTASAWVRSSNPSAAGYIFSFGEMQQAINHWSHGLAQSSNTQLVTMFGADESAAPTTYQLADVNNASNKNIWPLQYSTSWKHVTVTRKWNQATAADGDVAETGNYTVNLYVDGVLTATYTSATAARTTYASEYAHSDETAVNDVKLAIGNCAGGSGNAYGGSIGDFKLWTEVKTVEEIAADYNATVDGYYDTDSNLVFDMDLSLCDDSTITVADESGNNKIGTITYGVADQAKNAPTYGVTEQGTPYLVFNANGETAAEGTTLANRAVNVPITDTTVYDADEMTISAWVYSDNVASKGYLFSFGEATQATSWAYSMRHINNVMVNTMFNSDGSGAPAAECTLVDSTLETNQNYVWKADKNNSWRHVTVTRKWTQTAAATETTKETGYYTVNLFVDGVLAGNYTQEAGDRQTYADAFGGENAIKLAIGNTAGGSGIAYGGKIADFKLYTRTLTTDEIAGDYTATKSGFYTEEVVDPEEPGEDPEEPVDPEDPETPSEPTEEGLVFDMDLSGCNATTIAVADSSNSGKTGTITYGVADQAKNRPTYGVTEQGTPYLVFNASGETAAEGTTLANRAVNVPITDTTVYDADEMTISAWVYSDNVASKGYLFSFGEATQATSWAYSMRHINNVMVNTMFNSDGSGAPAAECTLVDSTLATNQNYVWKADKNNSWRHVTVTRKWTQTAAATETTKETGYYTVNLFIDGVAAGSYTQEAGDRQTYADAFGGENAIKLAIGNTAGGSGIAYGGKIADFKLYTKTLTTEEIAGDYTATKSGFYTEEVVDPEEPGEDPEEPVDPEDPETPSEPTEEGLVFDMDLSNCNATTIAVADSSNSGKTGTITYGVADQAKNRPTYGVTEQGTPYLVFNASGETAAEGTTLANRAVNVPITDTTVYDADEMTISAWVYSDNVTSKGYLFSFGEATQATSWAYSMRHINNVMVNTMFNSDGSGAPAAECTLVDSTLATNPEYVWKADKNNSWRHVTVTRKWTKTADATDTANEMGYYTVNLFIDGVLAGSYAQSASADRQTYADAFGGENAIKLAIGNTAGGSGIAYGGKIADFKLYTKTLTTEEIAGDYEATYAGFYTVEGGEEPGEDPEEPVDPEDPETPSEPTEEGLVFDMDLSNCNATTIAVADSSNSGKTGTITYGVADQAKNRPTYGVTEQGTPYLVFNASGETAAEGTTLANRAVNVPITDTTVYDADEMTISAWVYSDNVTSKGYLFSFGEATQATSWAYSMRHINNVMVNTMFNSDGSGAPAAECTLVDSTLATNPEYVWKADKNNSWRHVTVTRKWTKTADATDTANEMGYYTVNLFIDGVLAGSYAQPASADRQTYADAFGGENAIKLAIGNTAGGSGIAYGGKIADFKVYTKLLTTEEIATAYDNTKAGFGITSGGEEPGEDPEEPVDPEDPETPSEPTEEGLVFDMDLSNCNATTIAVADSSNSGKTGTITYGVADQAKNRPTYGVTEQGTPYLVFNASGETAAEGTTLANRAVNVPITDTTVYDADEMTISAWVYSDNVASKGYLFSFGEATQATSWAYSMRHINNVMVNTMFNSDGSGAPAAECTLVDSTLATNPEYVWKADKNNSWRHVTVTRKWTKTADATDTANEMGYYTVNLFIDGVAAGSYTQEAGERQTYADAFGGENAIKLAIGNTAGGSGIAYGGKIADFKLYTKTLTTEEIAGDYTATKSGFYTEEVVDPEEPGEDPEEPVDPEDPETPSEPTEEGLVFDMDLSGCNATTIAVADSSNSGKTGTITYGVADQAKNRPTYGVTEQGTPYLVFNASGETAAEGTTLANRAVNVPITDTTVYDADEMTISAWVYSDNVASKGYLFSFGEATQATSWAYSMRHINNVMVNTMFNSDGSGAPAAECTLVDSTLETNQNYVWKADKNNSWRHVTVTRKWTQTAAATETTKETGYYTVNLFVDGVLAGNYTQEAGDRQTYADAFGGENAIKLAIGNTAGGSGIAYGGKIADFKVYTKLLTTEEIATAYDNTKAGFGITSGGEEPGEDPEEPVEPEDPETPVEPADPDLVFDMDLSNCNSSTIAVKDESGNNKVGTITYGLADQAKNRPTYGETEQGTPYLVFNANGETAATGTNIGSRAVNVSITDTSVYDADEMTVSAWVYSDNNTNAVKGYLFSFGEAGNASNYAYGIRHINGRMMNAVLPVGASKAEYNLIDSTLEKNPEYVWPDANCNAWKHVTITRKWTQTAAATDTTKEKGYYTVNLFVDGLPAGSYTQAEGERYTYADVFGGESPVKLAIGNIASGSSLAYGGKIGDFKLWTAELSEDEIVADYMNSREDYYEIVKAWKSITFTDQDGNEITDSNGLLTSATEVTVNAEVADYADGGIVILGLYDSNGKLIDVETTPLSEPDSRAIARATLTAEGTDISKAVVYLWESATNIKPILPALTVLAKPAPLEISSLFKDEDGNKLTYMEGAASITAALTLIAGEPSDNIIANLKLMRGTEVLYSNTSDAAVFEFGRASLELAYVANDEYPTLPTAQAGDELLLTVTDAGKTVFEKRLPYADQSNIVDVILVAGQSNALGQGGNAALSLKPAADTVYYNTMGSKHLSTNGNTGWDSALGKTWHEETGRTVLIVKAAWGGTGFPNKNEIDTGSMYSTGSRYYGLWNPDNNMSLQNIPGGTVGDATTYTPRNCYTLAKNQYQAAIASIDTDKYTIGRQVYFWNQGENENGSYTAAEYEEAFMELHNAFKEDLGLEYGGIVPVRSSLLSDTKATDAANTSLKLTGPRIAQYKMGEEQDDIFVVADVMERWSSDENIKEWFADKYAGTVFDDIPNNWGTLMKDYVHYNQYALNEIGIAAAHGMLAHLRGQGTADGIDIITPNGIEHIENGGIITLPAADGDNKNCTINGVIPVMPVASGLEGTFTLSGDTAAELTEDGVLVPKTAIAGDFSTLTVTYTEGGVEKTMSFQVVSPLVNKAAQIEIAPVYNNYPAIYTLLTDDGYSVSHQWLNTELDRIETEKGLEENTLKATMGLVPAWMGGTTRPGVMTWTEAQELVATGRWGVANHTQNHNQGAFATMTADELEAEIDGGRATLRSYFPTEKIVGLLTPGGHRNNLIRAKAAEEHFALRSTGASYNKLPLTQKTYAEAGTHPSGSLYNITAAGMTTSTTSESANAIVDGAIANEGWIVGMWHGIDGIGENSGAYQPVPTDVATAHLEYVADKAKAGELWVTTFDEASVYAKQRVNTRLSLKETTDTTIVFALEDDLGVNTLYDATLTVNVNLPSGWTSASATIGGETVPSTVAGGVLTMNIATRNAGNITITKN